MSEKPEQPIAAAEFPVVRYRPAYRFTSARRHQRRWRVVDGRCEADIGMARGGVESSEAKLSGGPDPLCGADVSAWLLPVGAVHGPKLGGVRQADIGQWVGSKPPAPLSFLPSFPTSPLSPTVNLVSRKTMCTSRWTTSRPPPGPATASFPRRTSLPMATIPWPPSRWSRMATAKAPSSRFRPASQPASQKENKTKKRFIIIFFPTLVARCSDFL
jgi:hypothetical protein